MELVALAGVVASATVISPSRIVPDKTTSSSPVPVSSSVEQEEESLGSSIVLPTPTEEACTVVLKDADAHVFQDGAFHASLLEDPIPADLFWVDETYSLPCIPLCGVYGMAYLPCLPLVLLRVSPTADFCKYLLEQCDGEQTDAYIVVHTGPVRQECQKFTCSNLNEINLMYHAWANGAMVLTPEFVSSFQVPMGVYDPVGVRSIHLNLKDSGVAFNTLEERSVVIHDCSFSPENAMLQLEDDLEVHAFTSMAVHNGRRTVVRHILPSTDAVENRLRTAIAGATTLPALLAAVDAACAPAGKLLRKAIT